MHDTHCNVAYTATTLQPLQQYCNTTATTLQQHRTSTAYTAQRRLHIGASQSVLHCVILTATQHTLQSTHCSTLQHATTCCNALQRAATHCNVLQRAATRCNTLQHAATRRNTLQRGITLSAAIPDCKPWT